LLVFIAFIFIGSALANECTYNASDGSFYDLHLLRKMHGKPYSFTDEEGNEWLFNVCGDLSNLKVDYCPKDSVVCMRSKLGGVAVNAGKRASWSDFVNKSRGVEIVYGEGDMCDGSIPRKTIFDFVCPTVRSSRSSRRNSPISVTEVKEMDKCSTLIKVSSHFACPVATHGGPIIEDRERVHSKLMFMIPLFTLSMCCLFMCACCARRRRLSKMKKMQEQEMVQYANLAFQQSNTPFKQEPYVLQMPTNQQPMQFMPQYYVYPSVQVPHQQSPASLEKETLLAGDEQLAKELQAQYDREQM